MVTASSVDETIRAVLKCAYRFSYSIDDINEKEGRIVLSDSATLTSFGFFYPVYITSNAEGQTVIDVGAQSKWYFVGDYAVAPARARCFNAIKATVLFD
jgi:hypothetical protein